MYYKMDEVERRCLPTAEFRVEENSPKIIGYAAVFNTWADIGGWFRESIRPGAFAKTIKENDIRGLFNHDEDYVLGRNKAKTLSLREDEKGLRIEIDPPDTTWARDLLVSMRRGDVSQMSFGFTVNKQEVDYEKDERVLTDVTLFDVSVVTYPAYPTTSAEVRNAFTMKRASTSASISLDSFSTSDSSGSASAVTITYVPPDPPGFSELDRIVRKIKAREQLTDDEVRVVAAYLPDLSVPPAKHTETPPEPPAKHSDGDTRRDRWTDLYIRAERIAPSQTQ